MKPSTSTNSLTELTAVTPDNECFVCLEANHENGAGLVNSSKLISCGCRFHVHPICWQKWIREKQVVGNLEFPFCPICRQISQHPNPPQMAAYRTLSNKWFVILVLLIILSALILTIFFILYGNK